MYNIIIDLDAPGEKKPLGLSIPRDLEIELIKLSGARRIAGEPWGLARLLQEGAILLLAAENQKLAQGK